MAEWLPRNGQVGAVVVGGDYQGLGIVRSLGRHGIPVVVVDDEPSIAKYSRYTTRALRVSQLRDGPTIVRTMLDVGRRLGLHGWVIYPTRDEIVGAFSRQREELEEVFRVPTPSWPTVHVAWDKRLTYELADRLGIPAPRTWYAKDASELRTLGIGFPVVLKPAIKEQFIYVAQVKALRADTPAELEAIFRQACTVIPADEVMLQELIPGGGESQFSYCAFFKEGEAVVKMVVRRARQRPVDFARSSTCVETIDMPELEEPSERFLSRNRLLRPRGDRIQARRPRRPLQAARRQPADLGLALDRAGGRGRLRLLLFCDQLRRPVTPRRARPGVRWVRLTTDVPTSLGEIVRGRLDWRPFLSTVSQFDTEAVFDRRDPLPALAEMTLLPYLYRTRGARKWVTA